MDININEVIDNLCQEIAGLIRQVYVKDAQIKALNEFIAASTKVAEERPEVTE